LIGPGWLPRYRPRGLTRRALPFGRRRASKQRRGAKPTSSTRDSAIEIVRFDHGPAEFPVATVRPREPSAQLSALIGALQRWLIARWQWLRPRSVPCAVAGLGMMAILAFSNYLAHYNDGACVRSAPAHIEIAPSPSVPVYPLPQ
jgi:hypothetical protein